MGAAGFTAHIDNEVRYCADDSGRLRAYVMGVLEGSGTPAREAAERANDLLPPVTRDGGAIAVELRDGRTLHVRADRREEGE